MQFNLTARKFAALTLAGVISIAGTGIAFAADQSDNGQNGNRFHPNGVNFEEMSAIYQTALDGLVDEGTITQEQSEAVTENMAAKGDKIKNDGARIERPLSDILEELVTDDVLTQEQADAISESMPVKAERKKPNGQNLPAKRNGQFRSPMSSLVEEGILSQEQAAAIHEAVRKAIEAARESE